MIGHPQQLCQTATTQQIDAILDASMNILENKGLVIQSQLLCQALAQEGFHVGQKTQKVFFSKAMVVVLLKQVPARWILHARNPQKNIEIGGSNLAVVPGYGIHLHELLFVEVELRIGFSALA